MISWSPRGKKRLLECMRHIAEQCQDWPTVIIWRDSVYKQVEHLEDFPLSGVMVREIGRKDIRQILLGNYRIIYRVKNNIPEIISIRHCRILIRSMQEL